MRFFWGMLHIGSIETKKQRQQRAEELREMAKIFGWDKDGDTNG